MAKKRDERDKPTCEGYVSEAAMRKYFDPWFDDRELEQHKKPRKRPTSRRTRRGRNG